MFIPDSGILDLDAARRVQLCKHGRPAHGRARIRLLIAAGLAALAHRIAPELREPAVLRTRAAPN